MESVRDVPVSDGIFYTNRCGTKKSPGCGRALTKIEILDAMGASPPRASVCPCGGNSFRASNFKWWEQLFLFRSWRLWLAIRRGEILPPPSAREVETAQAAGLDEIDRLQREDMEGDDA